MIKLYSKINCGLRPFTHTCITKPPSMLYFHLVKKDSDHCVHQPGLITVISVCMEKVLFLSCTAKVGQTGWMPRMILVFAGHIKMYLNII